MITYASSPWFWVPIAVGVGLAFISAVAAYVYNHEKGQRPVHQDFFQGPVRNGASAAGTVIALLPIILSEDIRGDEISGSLLAATTILFLASMLIGLWLYTCIAALRKPNPNSVEVTWFWIAIQGVIFSFQALAVASLIAFVLFSPILSSAYKGPESTPTKVEGATPTQDVTPMKEEPEKKNGG